MIWTNLAILLMVLIKSLLINESVEHRDLPKKPNIILIMADDMGYSDIGAYGGDIETPVLDSLANNGVRFTQFYNGARCCPTRASLLTGLYPHQADIGHMTSPSSDFEGHDYFVSGYRGRLSKQTNTLAEVLKTSGYSTLMTGKWHLGMERRDEWPLQRGFDRYYGILDGASNFFHPVYPRGITMGNDTVSITDPDYYTTDAFTSNAIQFIQEEQNTDSSRPFFLYLAYTAPHWPLQAPKKDIDKYRGKYLNGWGKMREQKYQRMLKMGLIDAENTPPDIFDWDKLSAAQKEESALRRAIYAAQVDRMDQNIGKLVNYLKANNLFENTIIIFLSDNGGCAEGDDLGGGDKRELETKEGFFLSYGKGWANESNTPFKEYKHWLHEGGIAAPFIVHWPAGIKKSLQGDLIHQYSFLPDIMATFIDLSGAKYNTRKNNQIVPNFVGKSFIPLLQGVDKPIHEKPIFWEHEGNKAVRLGNYKAVMKWENKALEQKWELYDISKDRTELHDLSKKDPELLKNLTDYWQIWADNNQVRPWPQMLDSMLIKRTRRQEKLKQH